ncbi:MAG: hypothetical protein HQL77_08250 [Magnetococcales bacterium]|nr:hypothetical protein [Magnetococcales bacterium]
MSLIWVLIVCDDSFFREKLGGLIMESPNFGGAEWTDSSPMAVRQAISGGPNLAIVEVDSHKPGGFYVIDRLRQHGIPFMAMSVAGDPVATRRALDAGALDVFERESLFDDDTCRHLPDRILKAFEGGRKAVPGNNTARVTATPGAVLSPVAPSPARQPVGTAAAGVTKAAGIVAIASSTGGPKALVELLKVFPKDFSHPVVIAQHIHPDYVGGLEVWLARTTSFKVKIAAHGDSLLPGSLYIAPATGNMEVRGGGVLVLSAKQADDLYSPSCDRLLLSASQVYGSNAIGVILTGMGRDGVQGIRAIHEAGGYTLAQDRATSMVFSMPGSAIELKVVSQIGPPERLGQNIIKWVSAR